MTDLEKKIDEFISDGPSQNEADDSAASFAHRIEIFGIEG